MEELEGLSGICAGLGVVEEDENGRRIGYTTGGDCLENLRDFLRFLRRDDPQTRAVFKQVCKWNTVSKDLIPIIQYHQDDRSLVLNAVKVLVFLTMPIEPSSSDIPEQIEYLWGLKSALTNGDIILVIISLLEGPLENLDREAFTEDDWKLVQLVLTLFRNILAIQDISLPQKVGGSACELLSLRDKFLELLFHENVMDLILVITQHVGGSYSYLRQDNLLILEIFHYIFMGQGPDLIANAPLKSSKEGGDTKASLNGLKSIMEEEKEKRKFSKLHKMSRHSHFSGTFTRLTMDGSKAVYKGNPSSASPNIILKPHKLQRGRNKRIVWDHGRLPSMKDNILELLHTFLNQFLSGGYNVLMQSVREDIEKEHPAIQKGDIVIFFQVAQFVTSFQYHKFLTSKPNMENESTQLFTDAHADSTLFKGDACGPIAASMNESMFLLVLSRWRYAFEGLKETNDYMFLSAAGALMKIMIRMLDLVLKLFPDDSKEPQTARILLYKLFYDQTDQGMTQFLLNLIKSFDTYKQPKSDLADLVEIIHVIVRLMENLQARGKLRVSKKSRRTRKMKASSGKKGTGNEQNGEEITIQDQNVSSNAEHSIDLGILKEKNKADTTSDDQQHINIAVLVDKPEILLPETGNHGSNIPQMDERKIDNLDDLTCSSDDSSSNEKPAATCEVDFNVSTLISAFANHSIIHNLCWLLKFYKSNSTSTNHHIICTLRRITDDLELSPMLYQLSVLTAFYDILDEQKLCPCNEYVNIVSFLTSLVRRMLRKMKNQPLLFVELLFWKSRKECHYINAEYLVHELGNIRKESKAWGNVSVNGEISSSPARGWVPRSIADALGEDEADVVISHDLGYETMQENAGEELDIRSISNSNADGKETPHSGVNTIEHVVNGISKRKRRLVHTDELETRIKDLYEKFKDDGNCSRLIAESLDPDGLISPTQVFNKLKKLGFKVASKKRMRHAERQSSTDLELRGEKGRVTDEENDHKLNDLEENLRDSSSTKKRTRAFSKDDEEKIKALFEEFKDNKKCNYLIANAMSTDNSFTAAQVSRKLKQLGLRVPRQKRSQGNIHLGDEELNDFSVGGHGSDDETLSSLRNRSEEQNRQIDKKLSGDSDDELLSSLLKKTEKPLQKSRDKKLSTISIERKTSDKNSGESLKDNPQRERHSVPDGTDVEEIDKDIDVNNIVEGSHSEAELSGGISENPAGISSVNNGDDLANQELDEKLADSEDDAGSGELTGSAVLRRKLRMVIDDDD